MHIHIALGGNAVVRVVVLFNHSKHDKITAKFKFLLEKTKPLANQRVCNFDVTGNVNFAIWNFSIWSDNPTDSQEIFRNHRPQDFFVGTKRLFNLPKFKCHHRILKRNVCGSLICASRETKGQMLWPILFPLRTTTLRYFGLRYRHVESRVSL